jgi:hypothetical protein
LAEHTQQRFAHNVEGLDGKREHLSVGHLFEMKRANADSSNRLAYSWVLADQEISLVFDSQPMLKITELEVALPADDGLWLATNASDWARNLGAREGMGENMGGLLSKQQQPSLRQLFQSLLEDRLGHVKRPLQILHMRLLLYPIQILVYQQTQLQACFPTQNLATKGSKRALEISCAVRSNDIECLLQRWKRYFDNLPHAQTRLRMMRQAALIIYHLICLDVHVSIADIERFTRGEAAAFSSADLCYFNDHWLRCPEAVIVHSGQILGLTRQTEPELRPLWWGAAVYRAAIALWICGVFRSRERIESDMYVANSSTTAVPIDAAEEHDPTMQAYINERIGTPHLTRQDGTRVSLDDPAAILDVCIDTLDCGPVATKFCQGAKWKLKTLRKAWEALS